MRSVMWALVAAGLLGMCATGCSGGAGAVTSIANSKKPAGGGGGAMLPPDVPPPPIIKK